MSAQLIQKYYGAFNRRDFATMLECLTDDIRHEPNQGQPRVGKDLFRSFLDHMDQHYAEQVKDLVVLVSEDGTRGAAEFRIEGNYVRSEDGMPAARGQWYSLPVGAFFDLRDGRITRISNHYNLAAWIEDIR